MNRLYSRLLYIILIYFPVFLFGQSRLWEILHPNKKGVGYLYGTMHVKDTRVFTFPPKTLTCFDQCKLLCLELDPGDPAFMSLLMQYSQSPADSALDNLLSPAEYQQLSLWVKDSAGLELSTLKRFRPLFIHSLLMEKMDAGGNAEALDIWFYQRAVEKKIKVEGLETPEEQVQALSGISLTEQAHELYQWTQAPEIRNQSTQALMEAYLSGDLEALGKMAEEWEMDPTFKQALIEQRNTRMLNRMQAYLGDGSVFIAVGALHLAGDQGIIAGLRKAGYRVNPLP